MPFWHFLNSVVICKVADLRGPQKTRTGRWLLQRTSEVVLPSFVLFVEVLVPLWVGLSTPNPAVPCFGIAVIQLCEWMIDDRPWSPLTAQWKANPAPTTIHILQINMPKWGQHMSNEDFLAWIKSKKWLVESMNLYNTHVMTRDGGDGRLASAISRLQDEDRIGGIAKQDPWCLQATEHRNVTHIRG